MFAQSDSFRWLDPHLVLPGGPLWEDDAEENSSAAEALASPLSSTPPSTADRFTLALEHIHHTTQSDILSTSAENSWATSEVFQKLRGQALTSQGQRAPDRGISSWERRGGRTDTAADLEEDDDGVLLGALRGNGLLSLLTDDYEDVERHGPGAHAFPTTAGSSSARLGGMNALFGGDAAQRQARREAQQGTDMTNLFRALPRHLGVREEPVLCPLDPTKFAITHVATGAGVFAVVTAEMPQRVYVFDQMNDVLITCRELGGTTWPAPPLSSAPGPASDLTCAVEACTIDRGDRVRAVFVNPSGHICVVTMESGKAVYLYIPHRPSTLDDGGSGAKGDDEDDEVDDDQDEDEAAEAERRDAQRSRTASLADRGAKAWRRSARHWLHLGHRRKSSAASSGDADTASETSHDGEDEDERRYRPVGFSLTLVVRHASASGDDGDEQAPGTQQSVEMSLNREASDPLTGSASMNARVASSKRAVCVESLSWGCAEDAAVTQACLTHSAATRGTAKLVSAVIGSSHGGLVVACQFAHRRGLAALAIVGRLPLETHAAPSAGDALTRYFPMEAVEVFLERVPLAEGSAQATARDMASKVPGASNSASHSRGGAARPSSTPLPFPEYTHKAHFLSTDQYERAQGFQVAPASPDEAEETKRGAPTSTAPAEGQNTTDRPTRETTGFAVRATVLLAVRNRLYVFQTDQDTPAVAPSSSSSSMASTDRGDRSVGEGRAALSSATCFMDAMHAAFRTVHREGAARLASAYVSLPGAPPPSASSSSFSSAATTATGSVLTCMPSVVAARGPALGTSSSTHSTDVSADRGRLDLTGTARSSLQLLSPQRLLDGDREGQHSAAGEAVGRVTTPTSLAATLPATFYWQYKGWLVHGMVLTERLNGWTRLTTAPAHASNTDEDGGAASDAWGAWLHQRTVRIVARELLPSEDTPSAAPTARASSAQAPLGGSEHAAEVLLPIGILAIRDVQACLDGVVSATRTKATATTSPFSSTRRGDDEAPLDASLPPTSLPHLTSTEAAAATPYWPPLQSALVRGELPAATRLAVNGLRRQLDELALSAAHSCAAASGPRTGHAMPRLTESVAHLPSTTSTTTPPTRATTVRTNTATNTAVVTTTAGAVVSVTCSYDHILITTTTGIFVFFHLSATPLPDTALAWRNQLLLHTRWQSATAASASAVLFRVVADATPGAAFYCLSPVSVVGLTMTHSLVEQGTPALRQHVAQLLDVARAAAVETAPPDVPTEAPPRSPFRAQGGQKITSERSPRGVGTGRAPSKATARTRLAVLSGLTDNTAEAQRGAETLCRPLDAVLRDIEGEPRGVPTITTTTTTRATAPPRLPTRATENAAMPSVTALQPLLRRNPLLAVLLAHVAASSLRTPRTRYAFTVPFFGTVGGALVVSEADATDAVEVVAHHPLLANVTELPPPSIMVRYFASALPSPPSSSARRDIVGAAGWSHFYYACAPDYAYEMALQVALTAWTSGVQQQQHQLHLERRDMDDALKASLAMCAEVRHAYGVFLWQRRRLIESAAQLGHPGPVPLETLVQCFSRVAHGDGCREGETAGDASRTMSEVAEPSTVGAGVASSPLLPLILLLRLRLAAYEGSQRGTSAHRVKATALASVLVSALLEQASHAESFHLASVLTQPLLDGHGPAPAASLPPLSPHQATTLAAAKEGTSVLASRAALVRWKYHLDAPGALLQDLVLRYRTELPWAVVQRAVQRIANSRQGVWLAGELNRPWEACEGLLSRQRHVLEGLLCLEHLTQVHAGMDEPMVESTPQQASGDEEAGLALLLPFCTGPVRAASSAHRGDVHAKSEATHAATVPPKEAVWLQAFGAAVAEQVVSTVTSQHGQPLDADSNARSRRAALQSAESILYTSSLVDQSFPLAQPTETDTQDGRAAVAAELTTVLHATAAWVPRLVATSTPGDEARAPAVVVEELRAGQRNPSVASSSLSSAAGARRLRLRTRAARRVTSDSHDAAEMPMMRPSHSAYLDDDAPVHGVPADVLAALWQRFATAFMHYYPYRLLVRGLGGAVARAGLPFAAERLLPSLLTYTPAQNECQRVAGVRPKPSASQALVAAPNSVTITTVDELPMTPHTLVVLLALVWGSRTLLRTWQRQAGIAQTQQWLGRLMSPASLTRSAGRGGDGDSFGGDGAALGGAVSPHAPVVRAVTTTPEVFDSAIRLSDDDKEDDHEASDAAQPQRERRHSPARQLRFNTSVLSPSPDRDLELSSTTADSGHGVESADTSIEDDALALAPASPMTSTAAISQKAAQRALLRRVHATTSTAAGSGSSSSGSPHAHPQDGVSEAEPVPGHVALHFLLALAHDSHLTAQLWPDPLQPTRTATSKNDAQGLDEDTEEDGTVTFLAVDEPAERTPSTRAPLSLWLSLAYVVARDADAAGLEAFMELVATRCESARDGPRHGHRSSHAQTSQWWTSTVLPCLFRLFAHHKRRRGCAWVYYLLDHHEDALLLLLQDAQDEEHEKGEEENARGQQAPNTTATEGEEEAPLSTSLSLLVRFIHQAGETAKRRSAVAAAAALPQQQLQTFDAHRGIDAATNASLSALNPDEVARHTRHHLWLFVLRHLLTHASRPRPALALRLVHHSEQDVDITDVLPYMDVNTPMSAFKDGLYVSLATITTSLRRSKRLFAAAMSDLAVLQTETDVIKDRPVRVDGESRCFFCRQSSVARPFVVFRHCTHVCHVTCFREVRRRLQTESAHPITRGLSMASASASLSPVPTSVSFGSPTSLTAGTGFGTLHGDPRHDDLPAPQLFRLDEEGDHVEAEAEDADTECPWCSRAYLDVFLTAPLSAQLFTSEDGSLPTSVLNLL